jgi:hypothetical protein
VAGFLRQRRSEFGRYLRADPADLEVLDGDNAEERAELIAQRLQDWKSAANAFCPQSFLCADSPDPSQAP